MKNTLNKLDIYDQKIIAELDANARMSASEISREIRLPKETVNFRIKRLLNRGYIKNFYTIVNGAILGYQYYKFFFKFNNLTKEIEEKVKEFLLAEKSCANLRISEGFFDICFVSMHKNPEDLKEFVTRFHAQFGTNISLRSMNQIINNHKLSPNFLFSGKTIRKQIYHGRIGNYNLDEIDKKIISIISTQARKKLIEISNELKEDSKVISYHIKKLEKGKIIVGYFTALNLEIFNKYMIQIDISLKDSIKIPAIIDFFDQTKTCTFISEMLGRYDLTVEIYIDEDSEIRDIMQDFKEKFGKYIMFYDFSRIYREYVVNCSPFDAYTKAK